MLLPTRASSTVLSKQGIGLLSDAASKGWGRLSRVQCTALGHQHGLGWQPRPEIIFSGNTTMDIDRGPCCCITTDADMALSGSMGWHFTMASGGRAGHSQ